MSSRRTKWVRAVGATVCLALSAMPARADAIVPSLVFIWPSSWLLLIAVIPLEAAIAVWLLHVRFLAALRMSAAANAMSTLGGIPAIWVLLFGLSLVTGSFRAGQVLASAMLTATFMGSLKSIGLLGVITATLVFCIPLFLLSVLWEYRVAHRYLGTENGAEAKRWAWIANAVSYSLILVVLLIQAARALHSPGDVWI